MSEIKQLIAFNAREYNEAKNEIIRLCKNIQKYIDRINAIGTYKIDKEGLLNILQNNGKLVASRVETAMLDEIEKENISSPIAKETILKGYLEKVWEVINEFKYKITPNRFTSLVEVENGQVFVPANIIENDIRELFCRYITTTEGLNKKAQYDALMEAATTFVTGNSLFKNLESIGTAIMCGEYNLDFDRMAQ